LRPFLSEELDDEAIVRIAPLVKERLVRLSDARDLVAFLSETDATVRDRYDVEQLIPRKMGADEAVTALKAARRCFEPLTDADWSADVLEPRCRTAAEELGLKPGDFFKPLRVAVTGRTVSPPLFGSMELLGRERSMARIEAALGKLGAGSAVA
jgi:glutamyl-tRNA synthetase